MDLNSLLVQLEGCSQEIHDLLTLIALELENITEFFILVDVAIAAKVLLESLQDTLQVIFCRDTLYRGDSLTAVTLLTSDMDIVGRLSIVVTSIGERICSSRLASMWSGLIKQTITYQKT